MTADQTNTINAESALNSKLERIDKRLNEISETQQVLQTEQDVLVNLRNYLVAKQYDLNFDKVDGA